LREVGAQDGRDDDSDGDWGDWSLAGSYIVGRGGKVQFALVWPGADLFSGLLTIEGDTILYFLVITGQCSCSQLGKLSSKIKWFAAWF